LQSFALNLPQSIGSTRLRALRPTDLARFAAYRADAVLAEYQGWEPMDLAAAESFLRETASVTHFNPGGWIQLAIAESDLDELVGDVGLYLSEDCTYAELGFTLARAEHGKGHATRAAELAIAQVFRIASVREIRAVLHRAKFVQTGTRDVEFKGKPCTEMIFTRGRSEA
jgi:RimJ/RimL family protein N-acetyltransferase